MTRELVQGVLERTFPADLVGRLLTNFEQIKGDFAAGKNVEGLVAAGRYSEVVLAMVNFQATGSSNLATDDSKLFKLISSHPDADRLSLHHLYRAARDIYSLRNRKRSAHESTLDPTDLDSQYVRTTADWILAEMLRVHHTTDLEEGRRLISAIVRRQVPFVEEIDGIPVILRPDFSCARSILTLLYWVYGESLPAARIEELLASHFSKQNISVSLLSLSRKRLIHRRPKDAAYVLTQAGINHLENQSHVEQEEK